MAVLAGSVAAPVLLAAGCGWGPPSPPAPPEDRCADTDGPSPQTVRRAIAAVPAPAGSTWMPTAAGHTGDCRLHWVKLAAADADAAGPGPEQLLFFDRGTALGSPTPEPRPYITVLSSSAQTVTVQYQWPVGDDPPCCPTGAGTTRYRIVDGRLAALDPIPGS